MTMGASSGVLLTGVALRDGGTLSVWPDRLEVAGASYPVAEIAWAGLVSDPAAPAGMPPLPAIAWRTTSGLMASATPQEPQQAWHALEAIYGQRPDLRAPLPPPPPSPTGQPESWGPPPQGYPAYASYVPYAPSRTDNATVMAGLAHLSIFFGAPWVALVLWLVNREKVPFAADHARRAFFFQLVHFVIVVAAVAIFFAYFFNFNSMFFANPYQAEQGGFYSSFVLSIFIFEGVLIAIQIVSIVFCVIGAAKAFQGKPYHYPLMGRI